MEAAHIAPMRTGTARLRRYVLDSLAVGQSVAVHCTDRASARGVVDLGNRFGAQSAVNRSTRGWEVQIEAGSAHLDLYNLH